MITFDPGAGEPTHWQLCFSRKSATACANFLPIGKYKHVRAFGCVPEINTWIFFDPSFSRTSIRVARGDAAHELIREFLYAADVIQMPVRDRAGAPPLFGWCAPAVAHLLGLRCGALRGALVPDTLWRQCLANGGRLIELTNEHPETSEFTGRAATRAFPI
jgi:hypothetical protein